MTDCDFLWSMLDVANTLGKFVYATSDEVMSDRRHIVSDCSINTNIFRVLSGKEIKGMQNRWGE